MSVSGILGSSFFAGLNSTAVQNKFQQIQKGFQQLGQDLQSGNLSQAQNDFSSLKQLPPSQEQNAATVTPSTPAIDRLCVSDVRATSPGS
jgi:hypothetical protein